MRHPTDAERRPWKLDAACGTIDPETWYDSTQVAAAKQVCAGCPVRKNCLGFALDTEEPWGIWGGFTEAERRRLVKGVAVRGCDHCHLSFVPRWPSEKTCSTCAARPDSPSICDHRDEVTKLAGEGWSDSMIGSHIGFTASQVKYARRRWNVPSGQSARVARGAEDLLKPCGTPAALRRHKRRGEPVDDLCSQAEARRAADLRARAREVSV